MNKKILYAAAMLIAYSRIAGADTLPYVGMEMGMNIESWRLKDTSAVSTDFSAKGVLGGVFAGFGGTINPCFYLGIEGFANQDSTRSTTRLINVNGIPTGALIRARYSYGGSIIPAYLFSRAGRIYGRIGAIRTRFELHQNNVPAGSTSNLNRNTVTGGELGIGIQGSVARNLALRAEYDYLAYRTFTSFQNKIITRDNLFKVGMVYTFL